MKKLLYGVLLALVWGSAGLENGQADEALRRLQQSLRDQGFYYGATDGTPGDETTQAIRRYQIRNGLPVTGQLDDETKRSVEKTGTATAPASGGGTGRPGASRPEPIPTPAKPGRFDPINDAANASEPSYQRPTVRPVPDSTDRDRGRAEDNASETRGTQIDRPEPRGKPEAPPPQYVASPRNSVLPSGRLSAVFASTPYEFAPPPVQADTLRRAQAILTRQGFYDGAVNGLPSDLLTDSLLNFQGVNRLQKTGRLDVSTLGTLRLLPGRQASAPRDRQADDGRQNPNIIFEGRIVH